MSPKFYLSPLFTFLTIFFGNQVLLAQNPVPAGGGEVDIPATICITPTERTTIEAQLEKNIVELTKRGILKIASERSEAITKFAWPLRQAAGFDQPSYYNTTNFVDLQPNNGLLDYNCQQRTYDGHRGVDISLWPFWWKMMDENQVEVIAGATGVIISKQDNNFDHNCNCTGSWNAVYVQHPDGSIAWYGHLKTNSLTSLGIGETIQEGEYIGLVGSSGCSSNPHLHFEITDASSNKIEAYAGGCNQTTTASWWKDQKPYREPTLNMLMTHLDVPAFSGFCPEDENPDFRPEVMPGELVRFAAYYHDQTAGSITSFKVSTPSSTTFSEWNFNSPNTYTSSFWYWELPIPELAEDGIWKFEATYLNQTVVHEFFVGLEVSGTDQVSPDDFYLFPNPSDGIVNIKSNDTNFSQFKIFDQAGKLIKSGLLNVRSSKINLSNLENGIYFLALLDEKNKIVRREKVVIMK